MLSEERRAKDALRQRIYRRKRRELERAEAAAIARGETFVPPPKAPRGAHLAAYHFKPGHSSSRKGARNRLTHDFIVAFHRHFRAKGRAVFDRLLENEPATYAKLLTSLASKHVEISAAVMPGFSDAYALRLVAGIDRWLELNPDEDAQAPAATPDEGEDDDLVAQSPGSRVSAAPRPG